MRMLKLFFLLLAIVSGTAVYMVFASFSEHREYSSKSLDHYLLTPAELSAIAKLCTNQPAFVYSAADGPKPTIVTLNCMIDKDGIDTHLKSKGFQPSNDQYKKGDIEIQTEKDPHEEKVISVVLIDSI